MQPSTSTSINGAELRIGKDAANTLQLYCQSARKGSALCSRVPPNYPASHSPHDPTLTVRVILSYGFGAVPHLLCCLVYLNEEDMI